MILTLTHLSTQLYSYLMSEHSVQLVFGDSEALTVGAVHDHNDNLKEPQSVVSNTVNMFDIISVIR